MFVLTRINIIRLVLLLAMVASAAWIGQTTRSSAKLATAASPGSSADAVIQQITGSDGVLRFDVAEDGTSFAWDGSPALKNGMPDQATLYITQGYIYPEGTLNGSNGVLADGSPEFPDKVLGQWSCYGWYVGAGKPEQTAPWITSHIFNLGESFGEVTLVSDGYSIDDLEVALERAIVGGTGPYAGATGVQMETNLGHNASNGLDIRYEIHLAGE